MDWMDWAAAVSHEKGLQGTSPEPFARRHTRTHTEQFFGWQLYLLILHAGGKKGREGEEAFWNPTRLGAHCGL